MTTPPTAADGRDGPPLTPDRPITTLDVPIDERDERALPLAAWLAGCWQTRVRLLHVVRPGQDATVDLGATAEAMTRRWPGTEVETLALAGDDVATAVTGAGGVDSLLIVSTDNANAWSFKNSVAERLSNQAPGPIVLLGPRVQALSPGGDVVLADDGRPAADAAFNAATALAAALGRGLWLVRVVPDGDGQPAGPHADLDPEVGMALQERVDGVDPTLSPRWEVLTSNDPVSALEGFAERVGASFIVAGSRSRTDATRTTMSSIAMGLVANAGRPVLVVGH